VLDRLNDWLEAPGDPWLYLYGGVGRGKTGLAVGLLYELVSRGWSGAFKITTDLLTTIKSTFGTRENADNPGELDILHALYTVDIFVLDDLGSEYHRNGDDWATEKIFQVIDGRYVERKRMIITSNLNLRELAGRIGHPRAASRIHERTNPDWAIDMTQLPNLRMRT
jgi:DNA replication protein DnaC